MLKIATGFQSLFLGLLAVQTLSAQSNRPQDENLFPGYSATPTTNPLPGFQPTASDTPLPGDVPSPIAPTPLAVRPSVLMLTHLDPGEMSDADTRVVSDLRGELSQAAAQSTFDLSDPRWRYQQIACPALPGYVLLAFDHGPEKEGGSRFVAMLPRGHAAVRILPAFGHGLLPFQASWSRPGSFELFNRMLRQERGQAPLSYAPNWLVIGMCYAEVSGYPVQVLTALPTPEPTLDLLRLQANRPQLLVSPDESATVAFSDVSRPGITTNWSVHFNRRGEITGASHDDGRQPPAIALKP